MDKFSQIFSAKKANIGYIVAGYPSIEHSREFIAALDASSIDILEIGIPYSDPIADGPVIFDASFHAVQNGVNTESVFEMLSSVRTSKALVFLVYANVICAYGAEKFVERAREVGISGMIVPDLPYEENARLFELCEANGICLIPLISVTSLPRIDKLLSRARGFIYAVGAVGVTGTAQSPLALLENLVHEIKKKSDLPVAVGFGIRTNADVQATKRYADGAIIGTSIVRLCGEYSGVELMKKVDELFA